MDHPDNSGYLSSAQRKRKCGTRLFWCGDQVQVRTPHKPGGSKNALGSDGIRLKRSASGSRW